MRHATSCGTLIVSRSGHLLLCHVTGTDHWDIPKGMQEPGETTLEAAIREIAEETGLQFDPALFVELGRFPYRRDKDLFLYRLTVPEGFETLDHLVCTSHFPHRHSGKPTPEVDAFQWAARNEIGAMCWPRMAERLVGLEW